MEKNAISRIGAIRNFSSY